MKPKTRNRKRNAANLRISVATDTQLQSRGEGHKITLGTASSPFGNAFIASTPFGISHLSFFDETEDESLAAVIQDWPRAELVRDDAFASESIRKILDSSEQVNTSYQLFLKGTPFQIRVWKALIHIKPGNTSTYGSLAESIGAKSSARAVGNAVGRNRVSYLVPCHRVIRTNGELGGYRWGTERKKLMLKQEIPNWTAGS
ncbi:MAG: methylated-DNA--[protein]-cysteine S-methyltransferase [Akkermansiaceae bacterium]